MKEPTSEHIDKCRKIALVMRSIMQHEIEKEIGKMYEQETDLLLYSIFNYGKETQAVILNELYGINIEEDCEIAIHKVENENKN